GIDPERTLVVLRPPPDVSLYHRHANPLFPLTLEHLGRLDDVHAVVLPRTEAQREYVRSLELPSVIVPEQAVDAQSLIALADVVVSASGTRRLGPASAATRTSCSTCCSPLGASSGARARRAGRARRARRGRPHA